MKNSKDEIFPSIPLSEIIGASHNGILAFAADGKLIICNKAAKSILKWEDGEVLGKHGKELLKDVWPEFDAVLKTGISQIGKKVKRRNFTLLANRTPIIVKDKIVGVISVFEDISDLESQMEKSRRQTERYQMILERLRTQQNKSDQIIAVSPNMRKLVELVMRLAQVDLQVLIQGETGVGKEVIARLIHDKSLRSRKGMFMKIDCAAIPENLLESELFGYEEGAFTGANKRGKKGLFELAEKGTLFLDEVEALSMNLQVKLLNAVQDLKIMRVGGVKPIKINTRIIAASNTELYQMVQNKIFREDLFFRLNVAPIFIPPLRERKDDIIPLTNYFLQKYNAQYMKDKRLSRSVIDFFMEYEWPGNVRELKNIVEYLVVMSQNGEIEKEDLSSYVKPLRTMSMGPHDFSNFSSLREAVSKFEYHLINEAINRYGSVRRAAKFLRVDASTLTRKKKRHKVLHV